MNRHPLNPPDVYLEGAMTRISGLSKEHQGPRAVLSALERLSSSYNTEAAGLSDDVAIYTSQLPDYQGKLGDTFSHEEYLNDLTRLRDKLKATLSKRDHPNDAAKGPSSSELACQIKELTADHSVDTQRGRTEPKRIAAEEPVTARIRKRLEQAALHEADPPNSPGTPPGPFSERILRERAWKNDGQSPA